MSFSEYSEFDSNFFIPDISITETTPLTLEEILNQDEEPLENLIDEHELSSLLELSSAEVDFDLSFLQENAANCSTSLNISPIGHIKSQITLSKGERVNSGNPSSLTSSKTFIVVGTFYGHILVFDSNDKLKWFCKQEFEFGSISALSINGDEQRLLVGGSKGVVSLWNLTNGEMIRIVENLHAPFTSIINLKYLSDSNYAILSDTSGSVFVLDVRKKDFDSSCIFTGSRGEVLSMQPLIIDETTKEGASSDFGGIENLCIVAMATVSKVIVISVRPTLFVHFTFLLKANPEFLPLLSWNFSFRHKNKHIPLLTFGRQDQIFIHKMDSDFEDRINFIPLFQFKTSSYHLQNIFWLASDTFLIVDTTEKMHLIDFLSQEEVETVDLSPVELVYESANYKSLVNGGYVSKAMEKAGEHACANSFSLQHGPHQKNRLFILGLNSVFEATLRTWQERVEHLLAEGQSYAALALLHGKISQLKERNLEASKEELSLLKECLERMDGALEIFTTFLFEEKRLLSCRSEQQLRQVISALLQYTVCLPAQGRYERLFALYENLASHNDLARTTFLECLEAYIFSGDLPDLSPLLVKEIVTYYVGKRWYSLLDSLLVHFSITSLDIDYIVKIALDYFLYDAFIYIYNVAFRDFITPFDRLLEVLHGLISGGSSPASDSKATAHHQQYSKEDILLGNKLLVYLNCMLTCSYYPPGNLRGPLSPSEEFEHLEKVYGRILANGTNGKEVNVMNVLFKYDCTEFLNVILIAFDYLDQNHSDLMKWKQTFTDFFLLKIVEDETKQFNTDQQNAFFIFLARCLINSDSISITKKNFIKMIHSLFSKKESKRFEERQQILIQILSEQKFKHLYQQSLFLESAEKSQMYKICEYIHRQNQDWVALFFVYMKDPSKGPEVFEYVHTLLSKNGLLKTTEEKGRFLQEVVATHYLALVKKDVQKAVNLFVAYFDTQSEAVFERLTGQLAPEPQWLFKFLKLTLLCIQENYQYEKSLLKLVNSMLSGERHQLISRFQAANVRSRKVRQAHCGLCLRPAIGQGGGPSDKIVLYSCTHLFHEHCIQERIGRGGKNQQHQQLCPLCNGHLMRENGGDGSEHEVDEEEDEVDEVSAVGHQNGRQQQQLSQQTQLSLNETQFRALNYFHHGRLSSGTSRVGGRRTLK